MKKIITLLVFLLLVGIFAPQVSGDPLFKESWLVANAQPSGSVDQPSTDSQPPAVNPQPLPDRKVPEGILPGRNQTGRIQFALAGPVGIKIQTGLSFQNPEWRTSFPAGEYEIDMENLQIWDTRVSVVFPFLGFFFEGGMTLGGVFEGKMEYINTNGAPTNKFQAQIWGISLGVSADLYRQLGRSNFFLKLGLNYTFHKFYADSSPNSSSVSGTGPVSGLDSWYRWEWLELKVGMYYMPGHLLTGMFMGVDFIPGLWFFGKGRDKFTDPQYEAGTSDLFGQGGWGFSGLMGYQVHLSPKERVVFGFEWKYLKVDNGYFKRTTDTFYRRSPLRVETGAFWLFLRYETSF